MTVNPCIYERRRRGQRLGVMMGMKQGLDFDTRSSRRSAEDRAIAKFGDLVHFVGQYVDVTGASEGDVVQTSIELSKALGQTPVVDIEKMKAEFSKLQSQRDVRIANKPTSGKKGFSAKYDKSTGIISGKMKTLKNTIDVHPVGSVLFDINLIIIQPIIVELTGILNDLLNQISNQKKINDDLTIEITKLAKILQ